MIDVTIKRKQKQIEEITISGHAGSGPAGYDLVCAGVSAVSFGSINAVYRLCDLKLLIDQHGEGGYLHIAIPKDISEWQWEKAQLLLEGMIVSLEAIEKEYGTYIQIKNI